MLNIHVYSGRMKDIFHPAPFDFSHLAAGEPTISSEIRERYSINDFFNGSRGGCWGYISAADEPGWEISSLSWIVYHYHSALLSKCGKVW